MYNSILVVVDLSAESDWVLARAKALLTIDAATLTLLHVVEYVPMEPIGETLMPPIAVEKELLSRAAEKLLNLAERHGATGSKRLITVGSIKAEVLQAAKDLHADLIVVGNHPRHGLSALLNFVEDAVLHAAPCDVLAVQIPA